MIALKAHFDGKVLVPDEPLDLLPNQRVRIEIETIDVEAPPKPRTNFSEWIGLANIGNDRLHDPGVDEDAL